jgi:hypothetical protein
VLEVAVGAAVAAALGLDVGTVVGLAPGVALAAGVASAVGRAMTVTESPPAASVPTTTAWFLWGDWMIDRGRAEIATGFACLSRTGAQSGF